MIELIQVPWSPFCLVQKRILNFSGAAHKITNIPPSDRSRVWRLTRQRYYQVPVLKGGRNVIFDFDLWGMLANLLYSGHYKLPAAHPRLKQWYGRMSHLTNSWREKLHS